MENSTQRRGPDNPAPFFSPVIEWRIGLGLGPAVAVLAAGGAAFFLVAAFAGLVTPVFAETFDLAGSGLMADFAVTGLFLVGSVIEGDFPHLVGELHLGGAVVGGSDGQGAESHERGDGEDSDETFHTSTSHEWL